MPLSLSDLSDQLTSLADATVTRQQERRHAIVEAFEFLPDIRERNDALRECAQIAAHDLKWRCASPLRSPHCQDQPKPALAPTATILATDGSQVEPDRHGPALYYLINVGRIVYRRGSGEAPEVRSESDLRYHEEDLYEGDELVTGEILSAHMAIAEIDALADLTEATNTSEPLLALSDGPLYLFVRDRLPSKEDKQHKHRWHIERLRKAGAAVAGFISRPRSRDVVRLLYLASLGGIPDQASLDNYAYGRLTDAELFADRLAPGARTPLFEYPVLPDTITDRDATTFFYLNVGDEGRPEIARIEVPRWALDGPTEPYHLDLAHAEIVAQCAIAADYPYALARAHELALVSMQERLELNVRIQVALARQGIAATSSQKARLKEMTAGSSRRPSP